MIGKDIIMFGKYISCLILCQKILSREFHLNGSTLKIVEVLHLGNV